MYCPKCGDYCRSGDVVCPGCGSILPSKPAAPTHYGRTTDPANGVVASERPPVDFYAMTRSALSDTVSSWVFLLGTICISLGTLLAVILSAGDSTMASVNEVLVILGGDPIRDEGLLRLYSVLIQLVASAPSLAASVGLWMLYVQGKRSAPLNRNAVTLLWAAELLNTIVMCVLCLVLLFVIVGMSSGSAEVFMTVLSIIGGVFAVVILLQVKILKSLSVAREVVITSSPDSGISVAMYVLCFILGGITLVSGLFSLNLSSTLTGAGYIMFGCVAIGYRDAMGYVEDQMQYAENHRGPSAMPKENIPAWKRVQMEQGTDE